MQVTVCHRAIDLSLLRHYHAAAIKLRTARKTSCNVQLAQAATTATHPGLELHPHTSHAETCLPTVHDLDHELHVATHDTRVAVSLDSIPCLLSEDLVMAASHRSPLLLARRLLLTIG